MADRLAVLNQGVIQQVGTPAEVYDHPANRFVATFIGSSRMNLLGCSVDDDVLVGDAGWKLPVPDGARGASGKLQLGVRAENLSLDAPADVPGLDGVVYAVEPLGDRCLVDVEVGDEIVRVKTGPDVDYEAGRPVRVGVDMDRVHLFDAVSGEAVRRRSTAATDRAGATG